MKIGILSDIHEDRASLSKAMLRLQQFGCTQLVCLGDIVGYGSQHYDYQASRDADYCVSAIRENCMAVVAGNHDLHAVNRLPKFSAGNLLPENWYKMNYLQKKRGFGTQFWLYEDELQHNLSPKNVQYLQSLKEFELLNFGNIKIMLSHFMCPNLTGFSTKFPETKIDLKTHFEFLSEQNCTVSLYGHLHPNGILVGYPPKNFFAKFALPFRLNISDFKIDTSIKSCYSVPAVAQKNQHFFASVLDTDTFEFSLISD